ncbi:hypothetical protein BMF94_6513 [Rhodotorula taiwanensis]|uniref:Uncharacterized protein n=1 Tax=Rhodotorula taiwanensis TaxID=741276 RepID=A0A2S5B123_9BASI|nr:hypothetical protein BMF94_6513 [Rhodotorula taiwanensis]
MPSGNRTIDDQDIAIQYSGPWHFYRGSSPTSDPSRWNASDWFSGTFASCGGTDPTAPRATVPCEVRFPFRGTYAAMFGDSNGSHGVYSCRLESDEADMPTEAEGLWSWFDGGSLWWWKYRHNVTLCAVAGIPDASHTLVLSVQPSEVYQGIAFDFAQSSDLVPAGETFTWSSDFTTAVPPTEFRNTTATPILPTSTVAFGAAPSATNGAGSYSDGGASKLGIALGIGLGLGLPFLLGAGLAMWWYLRRKRRRASIDYSGTFEVQSVRNSKSPRALARDGDFGTDTLVDSGMEKEGTGWYGRAGHEGAYGSHATIPASPVHYSPASYDFALPPSPDATMPMLEQRASYPGSPSLYPPASSPQRHRWSAPTFQGDSDDLAPVPSREISGLDLPPDAELDDPNTFRER